MEWDVHHDSGFSLDGLMHPEDQEESGALRDMLNTRAVVLISTEKMSRSAADLGVQLGVLSHSRILGEAVLQYCSLGSQGNAMLTIPVLF